MARRVALPVPEESISCNVVPLLDVMFLLLLFLMIGSDMSHAEAAQLALPEASEAKDPEHGSAGRVVVLNVSHRADVSCGVHAAAQPCRDESHWTYSVVGREFGAQSLADRLAAVAADSGGSDAPVAAGGRRLSAVTLTIRCDRGAPYGLVQQALQACAAAGIHRTEVAAAQPAR